MVPGPTLTVSLSQKCTIYIGKVKTSVLTKTTHSIFALLGRSCSSRTDHALACTARAKTPTVEAASVHPRERTGEWRAEGFPIKRSTFAPYGEILAAPAVRRLGRAGVEAPRRSGVYADGS